jgi:hypothetical protein
LRGKATAGDDSDEEINSATGKTSRSSNKLELLSIAEIRDVLAEDETLQEEDFGELIADIANHLYP